MYQGFCWQGSVSYRVCFYLSSSWSQLCHLSYAYDLRVRNREEGTGLWEKWDVEVPTGSWAGVVPEFPLHHPLVLSIPAQCVWPCHLPAAVILGMENRVLFDLQVSLAQCSKHPIESRKSCADQKTTSTAYSVSNIYAVPACELEIISVTIGKERQEFQRA